MQKHSPCVILVHPAICLAVGFRSERFLSNTSHTSLSYSEPQLTFLGIEQKLKQLQSYKQVHISQIQSHHELRHYLETTPPQQSSHCRRNAEHSHLNGVCRNPRVPSLFSRHFTQRCIPCQNHRPIRPRACPFRLFCKWYRQGNWLR